MGAQRPIDWVGDVWTWVGLDADTKLALSWYASDRSRSAAVMFMRDLRSRVGEHTQISTDGFAVYPQAVDEAFCLMRSSTTNWFTASPVTTNSTTHTLSVTT